MSENHNPFHRLGKPGGEGCPLGVLPINGKDSEGNTFSAQLLDAGKEASEIELLRTIASRFGVQWGSDDLGWWAVVREAEFPSWAVWRQDDLGNEYLVEPNLTETMARKMVQDFEAKGHKQTYSCSETKQS